MDVLGRIRALVTIYMDVLSENQYLPLFVLNEMNQNPEKFTGLFVQHVVIHMKQFIFQIEDEVQQGKINPIHPLHLLLNVLSLIIFPFAALPVMNQIIEKSGITENFEVITMDHFLKERKKIVYEFIENALVPKKS